MTVYYRSVVQVEVLSDRQVYDEELRDLNMLQYITDQGDCSGMATVVTLNEEVSKERMAELLIAQGSDPEFLIHDDDEYDLI